VREREREEEREERKEAETEVRIYCWLVYKIVRFIYSEWCTVVYRLLVSNSGKPITFPLNSRAVKRKAREQGRREEKKR